LLSKNPSPTFADEELKALKDVAFNANNIYYKKHTLLIKPINEAAQLNNSFKNLIINSEQLTNCIEIAFPGIQCTLIFVIGGKVGLFPKIIASDYSLSSEVVLTENFRLLDQGDLRSLANSAVCALVKAEWKELKVVGSIKPVADFNVKVSDAANFQVILTTEVVGEKLTDMMLNKYSYKTLSEALDLDTQNSEKS